MFRPQFAIGLSLALLLIGGSGCLPTGSDSTPTSPTPQPSVTPEQPSNPYSNLTYSAALRSASLKLRGQLPSAADTKDVLDQGRPAYERLIDEYLASPEFVPAMREQFKSWFGLGDGDVLVFDPYVFTAVNLDTDQPANLAAYVLDNDLSWGEVFTADYCVDDSLAQTPCTGGLPVEQRAGILTNQSLVRLYGKPDAFNYQRTSIAHQLLTCSIYPDGGADLVRTNAGAGTLPKDNPADPPRIHAKYQGSLAGETAEIFCAACHASLISRRPAFAKFDTQGFYRDEFTILDVETPDQNSDKCFVVPDGLTVGDLKTCDDVGFDPLVDGCCYDEGFTDVNSSDAQWCATPNEPCFGLYHGVSFTGPREYVDLVMDRDVSWDTFWNCQATRFHNFAFGLSQGVLGLQAGGGAPPTYVDPIVIEKYRSTFHHDNWKVRPMLKTLFTGDEYLASQVQGE